eukprot:TRINITY_DN1776_c0_g1_i1.p1 TRINITY_DN1776_c0_g1~~TRINITY_DN1776_c0_g1_i1.p1  ORF type:complete len:299 (-),score=44.29 TRINITY_DN1776_c0_g1_i1:197-1093(-)
MEVQTGLEEDERKMPVRTTQSQCASESNLCFASVTLRGLSIARTAPPFVDPYDGKGKDLFYTLPNELMVHWMNFLGIDDLFAVGVVCRRWRCLSLYCWNNKNFALGQKNECDIAYILLRNHAEVEETKLLELVQPWVITMGNHQAFHCIFFFLKYFPAMEELIWKTFKTVNWKETGSLQLLCNAVLNFMERDLPPVGVCSVMDQSYSQIFRLLSLMKLHLNKNIIYCSPLDKDVEVLLAFFNKMSSLNGLLGITAKSVLLDLCYRTENGRKVGNSTVRRIVQSDKWVVDLSTVPQKVR